jgi:hypothetical protein
MKWRHELLKSHETIFRLSSDVFRLSSDFSARHPTEQRELSDNRQILPKPPPMPNLPIIHRFFGLIYRFAPAENEPADQDHRKPTTLEWQPNVKVEHYRLKQDSVKHPEELKENPTPYRTNL